MPSRWLNREREVIPAPILAKPPSAELRPGQMDTDSLRPFDILDPIVEAYVEHTRRRSASPGSSPRSRPTNGAPHRASEYKRQQAAPVLKVASKSFGMGRRFPIAGVTGTACRCLLKGRGLSRPITAK